MYNPITVGTRLLKCGFWAVAMTAASTACAFAQSNLPAIGGIAPASAFSGQPGFTLTVSGSGFNGHDRIEWNGVSLPATTFLSAAQLTGTVTSSLITAPGAASVSVIDSSGDQSNNCGFTINPTPVLSGVLPASTIAGSPAFTLTVQGSNFASDSVVIWSGSPLTTTVVSSSQLTATVPASGIATAGSRTVNVTSAVAPKTGNCSFSITAAPVVQSLKPSAALAHSPSFTLSVRGANFTPDESITWNGSALATTRVSASQLTALIGSSLLSASGAVYVGAVTGAGVATPTKLPFNVQADPSITGLTPNVSAANAPSFTLTVNGSYFASGDVVQWNGAGLSTTFVSASQLTAHVAAANVALSGSQTVTVLATGSVVSGASIFTVTGAPTLTSIVADNCVAGVAGVTVTLQGANFPKDAVGTWDKTTVPTTWVSDTQLTATIPASDVATTQAANLAVSCSEAATTSSKTFTVKQGPILSNVVPTTVLANSSGASLTVNGAQFASGYTVIWNGSALPTTYVSSTQLTAVLPVLDIDVTGVGSVAVAAPGGIMSGSKPVTVTPDPAISQIGPANVPAGTPGVTIVISGANFTGGCKSFWNGSALNTVYVSATQLTAYAPASLLESPELATVVLKLNTISSNSKTFTIDALPALASILPNCIEQGGPSMPMTLKGSNFAQGSTVTWNGIGLSTTYVSPTMLTTVVPSALTESAGITQIAVHNPDSASTAALPFRVLVVSSAPLWNKPLVWSHYTLNYTYAYPTSGAGLYDELYPLDMSGAPPSQSPANDIALAQAEGIDAFAAEVVLNGSAADSVLSAADVSQPGFYVAPSLDLSTVANLSSSNMENAVVNAVEAYAYDAATHPSAARDNGSLVIWTFDTTAMPEANWQDAMSRIASAGINTTWIADIDGLFAGVTAFPQASITSYLDIFQSGYIWSSGRDPYWSQTVSLFQSLGHNYCGSMRPGSISATQYDDAQGTALMRSRWERNLANIGGTQWVDDVTWNDYSEASGVNPTSTWNTARADLNTFYAAKFHGLSAPNPNPELYVTTPEALNLSQSTAAEAMVINPTNQTLTARISLIDANGAQIGLTINTLVGPDSVGAATIPIDFVSQPAGGYCRAQAVMLDQNANVLQSVTGAPSVVYPAGAVNNVNIIYYSVPAYNSLPGIVGLTLTANGTPGQGIATLTAPTGVSVKFAEILYNTQESRQFYAGAPTSETVSTAGPGFYVARVIDQSRRVGYSNPVYVGP